MQLDLNWDGHGQTQDPEAKMNYHWKRLSADQSVLLEEGAGEWKGNPMRGVGAQIIKLGPYMGNPNITYRADGPLVEPAQDFDSEEEAISAVEQIVRAASHTIDGR